MAAKGGIRVEDVLPDFVRDIEVWRCRALRRFRREQGGQQEGRFRVDCIELFVVTDHAVKKSRVCSEQNVHHVVSHALRLSVGGAADRNPLDR
jgi:hypothetical protein